MGSVMTDARDAEGVADREAAEWHVRLGERPVSAATLEAFKDWRRTPANAEAWRRVENLMRGARVLSSDPDIQALTRNTLRSSGRKDRGFVAGPRHLALDARPQSPFDRRGGTACAAVGGRHPGAPGH
jgi:ferric-dicitrate binding protein FerR (iron transport regulator)